MRSLRFTSAASRLFVPALFALATACASSAPKPEVEDDDALYRNEDSPPDAVHVYASRVVVTEVGDASGLAVGAACVVTEPLMDAGDGWLRGRLACDDGAEAAVTRVRVRDE